MNTSKLTEKARDVRANRKADRLLMVNAIGKARFATMKDRVMHWLFGILPNKM